MIAPVPGCHAAQVYVAPGCYKMDVTGGIEVRCPQSTTRYRCEKGKS